MFVIGRAAGRIGRASNIAADAGEALALCDRAARTLLRPSSSAAAAEDGAPVDLCSSYTFIYFIRGLLFY